MRLLIITFDPPQNIGGVEGRVNGYVSELERRGEFVEIEALAHNYTSTIEPFNGTSVSKQSSDGRNLPSALWHTARLLRKDSIDIVFFLSGALTIFGLLALSYCRLTGRKAAILFYGKDILQARKGHLGRLLLFLSPRLANRVVCNSRYTSSLLPRKVAGKISILYPSVDPSLARETSRHENERNRFTILFVGRLVKRKGMADLIDALRLLLNDFPDARLEIVGDGPEKGQLERLVSDLGLVDSVIFFGSLRGDPLSERYRNCDVFAMPSRTLEDDVEGFGTVFLEAGLFGKPSIGTFSGGIPEAVIDGGTGILVSEGDVGGLAQALRRLMSDEALRRELGSNARERVLARFTVQKAAEQLIAILDGREMK
jgi:phosphatidylinositol alpha-1,6-mannosyltransferase